MGNEYDAEGPMNDSDAVCLCLCGAVVTSANAAAVIAAMLWLQQPPNSLVLSVQSLRPTRVNLQEQLRVFFQSCAVEVCSLDLQQWWWPYTFGEKVCRSEWMSSHCPYLVCSPRQNLLLTPSLSFYFSQDVNTWGGYLGQVDEKDIESIQTALGADDA